MSAGKIHVIVGLCITALAFIFFYKFLAVPLVDLPLVIAIVFLYSLLPDIDHKMSSITWLLLISGCILFWMGYFHTTSPWIAQYISYDTTYFGGTLMSIAIFSALLLPHRGPTHTLWFVILSPFLILLVPNLNVPTFPLMVIAGIACYSHLIMDGLPFKLTHKPEEGLYKFGPQT